MAGGVEDRVNNARDLLSAARAEFERAKEAKGGAAVTTLRNSCGKGWLAALEAANAFLVKQGVAEEDLPDTDRGRRYFVRRYMDREMRRAFESLRGTFHIAGYYDGIVEFEDMPEYFDELKEFIDQVQEAPAQE
jgi:3-hydroxyisobutyrate dehydrogenase-like beta-hydroxyacid dehydrogenase